MNGCTPELAKQLNLDAKGLMKGNEVLRSEMAPRTIDVSQLVNYYDRLRKADDPRDVFKAARKFVRENEFANRVVALKKMLFSDGMTIAGGMAEELTRVAPEIWAEWLTCENAVAAWVQPVRGVPFIEVPKCEDCTYTDAFGAEALKIKFQPQTLTASQKEQLDQRYQNAIAAGSILTWGTDPDEQFAVLKSSAAFPAGKTGQGFGMPGIRAIFEALGTHALLSMGDWNAAWTAKDVIRMVKRGHSIDSGNLCGMPLHFLTSAQQKVILGEMAKRSGAFTIAVNFDVEMEYPIFDFDYFKEDKWKGVTGRMMTWGGSVAEMMRGEKSAETRKLAHIEAQAHRKAVTGMLTRIAEKCGFSDTKVTFSPVTFLTPTEVREIVNGATSAGLMSPQTARKWMDLDNAEEVKLMKEASSDRAGYTPPFEQKQGIVANLITETAKPPTNPPAT